jgi:hypothetical protein
MSRRHRIEHVFLALLGAAGLGEQSQGDRQPRSA